MVLEVLEDNGVELKVLENGWNAIELDNQQNNLTL